MSKPKIKKLKVKLMNLVKAHIKRRDNYTCQRCGKTDLVGHNCQGSHVYPDSQSELLSYDPINLKVLCFQCHMWWHENPTESGKWFASKFPERMEYINQHKNISVHWKEHDYLEMIEKAKEL